MTVFGLLFAVQKPEQCRLSYYCFGQQSGSYQNEEDLLDIPRPAMSPLPQPGVCWGGHVLWKQRLHRRHQRARETCRLLGVGFRGFWPCVGCEGALMLAHLSGDSPFLSVCGRDPATLVSSSRRLIGGFGVHWGLGFLKTALAQALK